MLRILCLVLGLLASAFSIAETEESTFSILDNRFRVDPRIDQITFMIHREQLSRSVILVRPDGVKYYVWQFPDNVSWYSDSDMDIISVTNPMPGPWQAVGKVTPANNITLLTDVSLDVDIFPKRLYQNEVLKFTARLLHNGKPLLLPEFLNKVALKVEFRSFVEDEELLAEEQIPSKFVLGRFLDNGEGLDEVSGDGVFTVDLPVTVEPGKYRARISTENGVFLRVEEQDVLVYPSPVAVNFLQSREDEKGHNMIVTGEQGMVVPGSLAVNIEQTTPDERQILTQSTVAEDSLITEFFLPNDPTPGKHTWKGTVYATEGAFQRELMINIPESGFSVMAQVDVEKTTEEFLKLQEEKKKQLEIERIQRDREEVRTDSLLLILIGNLVVILLGLVIWFIVSKLRYRRAIQPEMQLNVPPKP
ncbi:TIGR03503 family protein [Vibrio hannami]|uniref:TIGR03503 family protein n=1 Tax=Vibrio hannami TaxID=2717094 RepID=UPI002410AA4F|nr:TIGR03503 family protein [Vibrio hannami]MDG3088845.1 TIGR03503 family protein [Vibrio hannami]